MGLALAFSRAEAQTVHPGLIAVQGTPGVANETCLECHAKPDQSITLPSGEVLYLTTDPETYNNSVHGKAGYACVQCHTNITGYPHPPLTAQTRREVTVSMYESCGRCHQDKYSATMDSVHEQALANGNNEAAVCSDCHGAHNVQPAGEPRSAIPKTCERCHSQIYQTYAQSVHGSALIGDGNPDVPSCIDCHGVHNVTGPNTDTQFHLFSPQICEKCHADPELMAKYGISTDVLNTYLSDFHGTTVLFEELIPGQESNKPVCVDCHGHHDIRSPDDPDSSVMKANLLRTCQKCHPDATTNFPAAWMSHYVPSPEHYPIVYYTNLFYKLFIPTVLGGMVLFIAAESTRRLVNRSRKTKHE